MTDATSRSKAEQALLSGERRLDAVIRATQDAVWIWDFEKNEVERKGYSHLFGYPPELIPTGFAWWRDRVHPDDVGPVEITLTKAVQAGTTWHAEYRFRCANGTYRWVADRGCFERNVDGTVVGGIGALSDITKRKVLEEQLHHSQKMEAIGNLAGGVAHEFNNLLTIISGHTQLALLDDSTPPPSYSESLEAVRKATDRAISVTRQLLAFSRKQVLEPKVFSVDTALSNLHTMLRPTIGEDIELIFRCGATDGNIHADVAQFEQVLVNIAVNARDAMPEGGTLIIETRNVLIDDAYCWSHSSIKAGEYILIAITDTGMGMDTTTRSRIFEPFFTTKAPGKGTGLGLSMVYGIVRQSGGHIWVYSEVGQGTTFKIYLPRVYECLSSGERRSSSRSLKGSETILLVEDDDLLRDLICTFLVRNGYRVLTAAKGADAVQIAQAHAGPIHVVLTDMVMPGMPGNEVARLVRQHHPKAKVLVMSGYTATVIGERGVTINDPFVEKPFGETELVQKIRDILDTRVRKQRTKKSARPSTAPQEATPTN